MASTPPPRILPNYGAIADLGSSPAIEASRDNDSQGGVASANTQQSPQRMDDDEMPGGSGRVNHGATIEGEMSRSRRFCGSAASSSDSETADDAPLLADATATQPVRIEMPGEKPSSPHDRFPKRKIRALVAVGMLVCAAVLNDIVLSFVHEKYPLTQPLPDIVFDNVPYYKAGLTICEWLMLVSFSSVVVLMIVHRHRWIMLRRLAAIGSLLYMMRCVTMIVTQVPVADPNWHCAPKLAENATFWKVVLRGVELVAGVGLNVAGEKTLCGDYIYSGHTIVLVVSALFMSECEF
ncbi:unnamed protein product [Caenorhabditis auriculariae]|uniref:Sphingomyelin synthase-like domain-containing protein n=1 Tax=Caenorhabditis auriculariae TaxID=2777116 RepID=A0A8S1I0K5_9PELO|nr:unnamed protein product [Caenorhabditis auriculariae]